MSSFSPFLCFSGLRSLLIIQLIGILEEMLTILLNKVEDLSKDDERAREVGYV
jgi:hypothetical protein